MKRWEDFGNPFQRQRIEHFRRDMRYGRVSELRDVDHGDFLTDQNFQAYLTREVLLFLLSQLLGRRPNVLPLSRERRISNSVRPEPS